MQQQNDSRCSCAKHWRHLKREAKQWCQIFVKCLLLHVLCSRLCWEELRCEDLQTEKGGCLSPVVPTLSCACLYLNLTLTDHLLCSQPAHLTHIHNQAQQWVSFLLFQSNSVVTHTFRPSWDFAWPEGKVSALHSAMILFSVSQSLPIPAQLCTAETAQSSHQDLTFSLSDSFHYSLWSIDQKKYFHTKFGTFLYYYNSSIGEKDQWKIKRLGRIKKK